MSSAVIIALAAIIVALAITSVYLYQKSTSLEGIVSQLQMTNKELTNSLANAKNNQTGSSVVTGTLPQSLINPHGGEGSQASGRNNNNNNNNTPILNSTSLSITAVAVKAVPVSDGFFETIRYQGAVMDITVEIRDNGKGLVLVNTEVPTGVDFQTSARMAVKVAQSITRADLSDKDVIFSIRSKRAGSTSGDLQAVDGSSASAAMTVLLIAQLLEGERGEGEEENDDGIGSGSTGGLRQDVVMTGTINPDGTIGPVGGVPEKALAAAQYGAKIFLVPKGQAVYMEQTCQVRQEWPIIYQTCQFQKRPLSDYMEKNYGMKVIEVEDVNEALAHFRSG